MSKTFFEQDLSILASGQMALPWVDTEILITTLVTAKAAGPSQNIVASYNAYRPAYFDGANYKIDDNSGEIIDGSIIVNGNNFKLTAYVYFAGSSFISETYANREKMIWKAIIPADFRSDPTTLSFKISAYAGKVYMNSCTNFNDGSDSNDKDITSVFVSGELNKIEILFHFADSDSSATAKSFVNDVFVDDMNASDLLAISSPLASIRVDHNPAAITRSRVFATKSVKYERVDTVIGSASFTESGSLAMTESNESAASLAEKNPSSQLSERVKFQASNFQSRRLA